MQCKSALIGKNIESFALGIPRGGGVVFALVEKSPGLLAFERIEMKLYAVHGEHSGGLCAILARRFLATQEAGILRRKLFEQPDFGIDPLDDGCRFEFFRKCGKQVLANGFRVHCLGEDLQRKDVLIFIDDEAGEKVGFAKDEAVGVGIVHNFLAIGDGIGNSLAQKGWEIADLIARNEANRDLRSGRIERRSEKLSARIGYGYDGIRVRPRRRRQHPTGRPRRGHLSNARRRAN